MELWLRCDMESKRVECNRRDTGLRWRSRRVRCYTKQTMRFSLRIVRTGSSMRVYELRGCEHNQYQDEERRRDLTQLRAIILDGLVHT
jgi:hypothetical protein